MPQKNFIGLIKTDTTHWFQAYKIQHGIEINIYINILLYMYTFWFGLFV